MALHSLPNKLAKSLLIAFLITALAYLIYWLWQRQPKQIDQPQSPSIAKDQIVEPLQEDLTVSTLPKDGTILESTEAEFTIKSEPNSYVVLLSDNIETVIRSNTTGQSKTKTTLEEGFNLLKIIALSQDLQKTKETEMVLFAQSQKKKTSANIVVAGVVKNIFQNAITLTSTQGEKTIKTTSQSKINLTSSLPTKSPPPKNEDQNVRIGDYLVVLGSENGKEIAAGEIDVYRQDKPQIVKQVDNFKLLSNVKKPENFFSAKEEKTNQITEFTLDKNSTIIKDGKKLTSSDLQKDSRAIIVYHKDNEKIIPNLIYLLP